MESLYHQLGGKTGIALIVDVFYLNVLKDSRISRFFRDLSIEKQFAEQTDFAIMALDGPLQHHGNELRRIFIPVVDKEWNHRHWNALVEDFIDALKQFGYSQGIIDDVVVTIETKRKEIVGGVK